MKLLELRERIERERSSLMHIECFYEAKDAKRRILDMIAAIDRAEEFGAALIQIAESSHLSGETLAGMATAALAKVTP